MCRKYDSYKILKLVIQDNIRKPYTKLYYINKTSEIL